jgi:hypothetical protein
MAGILCVRRFGTIPPRPFLVQVPSRKFPRRTDCQSVQICQTDWGFDRSIVQNAGIPDSDPKRKPVEGGPLAGASGYSTQDSDQGPNPLAGFALIKFRGTLLDGNPSQFPRDFA